MGAWPIFHSPLFGTYVELALLAYSRRDVRRIFREFDNWQEGRPLDYVEKRRPVFRYRARLSKRKREKPKRPYKPLVDFEEFFKPPPHLVGVTREPPPGAKSVYGEAWGDEEYDPDEPIFVLDVKPYDEWPQKLTDRRQGVIKRTHRSSLYDRTHPWWKTWKPPLHKKKARRRKQPVNAAVRELQNEAKDRELEASIRAFYASKAAKRVDRQLARQHPKSGRRGTFARLGSSDFLPSCGPLYYGPRHVPQQIH